MTLLRHSEMFLGLMKCCARFSVIWGRILQDNTHS